MRRPQKRGVSAQWRAMVSITNITDLRPLQFVATENPWATSNLAMPTPMSPIEMMPILANEDAILRGLVFLPIYLCIVTTSCLESIRLVVHTWATYLRTP